MVRYRDMALLDRQTRQADSCGDMYRRPSERMRDSKIHECKEVTDVQHAIKPNTPLHDDCSGIDARLDSQFASISGFDKNNDTSIVITQFIELHSHIMSLASQTVFAGNDGLEAEATMETCKGVPAPETKHVRCLVCHQADRIAP